MKIKDVYSECAILKNDVIKLKRTTMDDAEELLKCYSDKNAIPLFNSDNCNGDTFYYQTIERMKQGIELWEFYYKSKKFVRWTITLNYTNEKIGTIEMFNRDGKNGVLRIDLQSQYEVHKVIEAILVIANEYFYDLFSVEGIFTKAIPCANKRITVLEELDYKLADKNIFKFDNYYWRQRVSE